jgi:hypothetical protein
LLQRRNCTAFIRHVHGMNIIHLAAMAGVPVLLGSYLAALRWATRPDRPRRRGGRGSPPLT